MENVVAAVGDCLAAVPGVRVAHERRLPEVAPTYEPVSGLPLDPRLARYLKAKFPTGLFSHQRAALQEVLAGRHAVLSTATSSGKSLVFMVAAFQAYLADPEATCLFIYPQKALENDQLDKLRGMYEGLFVQAPPADFLARYDGATPADRKPAIRRNGQFVLTNPDMLHYAMLQYHERHWSRFFRRLTCVAIDEAHAYAGIFGTSVAYILRRLRCVCRRHGRRPVFVSASATIGRPALHLARMTGLPFTEIGPEWDGSRQGAKRLWLVTGTKPYGEIGRDLLLAFVAKGLCCLAFCPGRVSAETVLAEIPPAQMKGGRIRVYRAGLSPAEREAIEDGAKRGTIRGVLATSALELGIDIGQLDVVLCIGLPNTMPSLWQRAGRVGRSGKEGAVVFVAADRPLDTYFLHHPDEFYGRRYEPLALNLQNRRLVCHHLACAIREAGGEASVDTRPLGAPMRHALARRREGRLKAEAFYADAPHMQTPIRTGGGRPYRIVVAGGEEIGEIDPWHLLREAYPNAIYLHGGRRFRVHDVLRGRLEVRVHPERSANSTHPFVLRTIHTLHVLGERSCGGAVVRKARFDVTERLAHVLERNRRGEPVQRYAGSQGLPPHTLPTEGVSVEAIPPLTAKIASAISRSSQMSVVRAIERLVGGLFPLVTGPCDPGDYGTFAEARGGRLAWYLYDAVQGGIGLAVQAYARIPDLLTKALDRVTGCGCAEDGGCFRCVRDPEREDPASKSDCAAALERLCGALRGAPPGRRIRGPISIA